MRKNSLGLAAVTAVAFGLAACGGSSSPASGGSGTSTTAAANSGASTTSTSSATTPAQSLSTGDCFNSGLTSGNSGNVKNITKIDCTQSHQYEVIATEQTALGSDGAFPGASALETEATNFCKAQFKTYVGVDYSASSYGLQPVFPTQASWGSGDRIEQCWVHGQNGASVTGSVKGTSK